MSKAYETMLTRFHWLRLSNEERDWMRRIFSIRRSRGVEMQGGVVTCDGSDENDLLAVNVDSMREFLGSDDTSFESLFEATVARVRLDIETDARERQIAESRATAERELSESEVQVQQVLILYDRLPKSAQSRVLAIIGKSNAVYGEDEDPDVETNNKAEEGKEGGDKRRAKGNAGRGKPSA